MTGLSDGPFSRLDFDLPRRGGWGSRILIGTAVLIGLFILLNVAIDQYVSFLWFNALGYSSVFTTILGVRIGLFAIAAVVTFAVLAANLLMVRLLVAPRPPAYIPQRELIDSGSIYRWMALGASLLLALAFALAVSANWSTILLGLNGVGFGSADPIFGMDIGTFVFSLPLARFLQQWLFGLAFMTLLATGIAYGALISIERPRVLLSPPVLAHLSAIGVVVLLAVAGGYWLDRFDLLTEFRPSARVQGAGYTAVNVRLPALGLLAGLAILSAIVLIVNLRLRRIWPVATAAILWAAAGLILNGVVPGVVQRLVVEPSELSIEMPYLGFDIQATRRAYGIEGIEDRPFPAVEDLTQADVNRNPGTFGNIRLWDYKPLRDTYNQVQSIRTYYEFDDPDIDRYRIRGQVRQVMLAARELAPNQIAAQARTWVAQRLQYTHGYGVAMSAVNEAEGEGLPSFLIRDVPPTGDIPITQPAIYFGERTTSYVIVKSTDPNLEFDYPAGEGTVSTRYTGNLGVPIGSFINRLIMAYHYADANILISNYIGPDSQLLMNRTIRERILTLAPFLTLDQDPYIVIADGKLYWMVDAYTTTDQYPYSAPLSLNGSAINYIRNSVKITVDAYDGAVSFYVSDPNDPIVQTYRKIFPSMFRPLDDMPASLRDHIRYPETLFKVQADRFQTYHMTDIQQFYNREDQWATPNEVFGAASASRVMEPYYIIMRLPGETTEEFVLILPFTPKSRDNMIAWMAARTDGPNYGKLIAIRFPKDRLVFGPAQIAARINQDPVISQQLSLWNQQGSSVIPGNLLVIPIERSVVYVEPLFLQANKSPFPELKRVVLATQNRVVMEPTLGEALARLLGGTPPTPGTPPPATGPPTTGGNPTVATLVRSAQANYDRAQERLRAGDFAGYGEAIRLLEADLRRLAEITG